MPAPRLHSDLKQEKPLSAAELLDQEFPGARARVLDLAAFLDRIDRHGGSLEDYRGRSLKAAFQELASCEPGRAARILELLSDPTDEPIAAAPGKAANGAWKDFGK